MAILLGLTIRTVAQTNAPVPASASATSGQTTEIFADQVEIDWKTNLVVYRGNVRVENPKMRMTCELLTARTPGLSGRIESIVAERNVVIDSVDERGQKIHGRSEKAIYSFKATETETNEIVELTGNPVLETSQATLTGEPIIYDRITGKIRAINQKMVVRMGTPGATNEIASTNPPAHVPPPESRDTTTNSVSEPAPANPQPPQ